jgi:uncharacterized protein (TIGR02996 family)
MTPWLKRIELATGVVSFVPLEEGRVLTLTRQGPLFPAARFASPPSMTSLLPRGDTWHVKDGRQERWLLHGSRLDLGDALYVFMEYPEARNLALEAELPTSEAAAFVYADWLEEQGDPFAAAVKPELARERGPAGLWWLEGFERSTPSLQWTARAGFVREATLRGTWMDPWQLVLFHLCTLRALVALERLTLTASALVDAPSGEPVDLDTSPAWRVLPFPSSLRRLTVERELSPKEEASLRATLEARGVRLEVAPAPAPQRQGGRPVKA